MWDETGLRCSLFYSLVNDLVVLYCIVVDKFLKFQNMGSCRVVAKDKFSLSILAYWRAYALYCIWQCFTNKPFSLKIFPEAGCPVFSLKMISFKSFKAQCMLRMFIFQSSACSFRTDMDRSLACELRSIAWVDFSRNYLGLCCPMTSNSVPIEITMGFDWVLISACKRFKIFSTQRTGSIPERTPCKMSSQKIRTLLCLTDESYVGRNRS